MPLTSRLILFVLFIVVSTPVTAVAQSTPNVNWWRQTKEWTSRYYTIKTDLTPEEMRPYARHLDRMYEEYRRRLGSLQPREEEKLNILLFKRRVDYMHVLNVEYGIDASGSGGMFFVTRRGTAFALWLENLSRRRIDHVMQHEGFHQFAHSRFGGDLPIWVNEGLAEFFGESILVDDTFVLGQSTPRLLSRIQNAIEQETTIPFDALLAMTPQEWLRNVQQGYAHIQYEQAWSMVQFLIYGEGGRYQKAFERYLRKLNAAVPARAAWNEVFGPDVKPFEDAWKTFAMNSRPSAFMTALERAEFLAEGMMELSRRGQQPKSLDELKRSLQEIGFEQQIQGHQRMRLVKASDDANYVIPSDDLSTDAKFVMEEKRRRLSARQRRWEEQQPTPLILRTEGLKPNGITVTWVRDRKTGALTYELEIK